jgi:hypothetical protein
MQRVLRSVLALVAAFLSAVVLVGGPGAPAAYAVDDLDLGGGSFPVSPTGTATVVAAAGGVTLGGVLQGALEWTTAAGALYATSDTWIPWVTGLFGTENEHDEGYDSIHNLAACQSSMAWETGHGPADDVSTTSENYQVRVTWACSGNNVTSTPTYGYTMICKSLTTGGQTVNNNGQAITLGVAGNSSAVTSIPGCGVGFTPQFYSITGSTFFYGNGTYGTVNSLSWGAAYDPGLAPYTVDVVCRKDDGTTSTISLTSTGNVKVPSCWAQFGGDAHGESATVKTSFPGGDSTNANSPKVGTITEPTTSSTYPNCIGTGKRCLLKVYWDASPCSDSIDPQCTDWLRRVSNGHSTEYECHWGGYVVPMTNCYVLERAYAPDGTNVARSQADVDGDPDTKSAVYETPDPSSTPTGGTGTGSIPTEGPNPTHQPAPTDTTDPDDQGCWGSSWSWNPVSWVVTPVKCVFVWAFVPTDAAKATMSGLSDDFGSKAPFSYVGDGVTFVGDLDSGTGQECYDIVIPLGTYIGDVPVFDTCSGLGAILEDHRTILSIALYAGFVVPMIWWAWKAYAPGTAGVA